jgi:hypothetical protein
MSAKKGMSIHFHKAFLLFKVTDGNLYMCMYNNAFVKSFICAAFVGNISTA